MKKLFALILSVLMLFSLTACAESATDDTGPGTTGAANSNGTNPTGSTQQEEIPATTVDNRPVITIGMPVDANVVSVEDNALTRWIEGMLGVKLEFTLYAGGSEIGTQIATTVAAGQKLPDILYGIDLTDEQLTQFVRDGYFWDLTPYFNDRDGATLNFWGRLEEKLTQEQVTAVEEVIVTEDGKYHIVPTVETTGNAEAVEVTCKRNTFISKDCVDPDFAFEVLMLLWSEEGSLRVRYGEYGANWEDADEGAKSEAGLDATVKVILDPRTQPNTSHWGVVACCFNEYANGETVQKP